MRFIVFILLAITMGCSSPKHEYGKATQQFFKLDSKLQFVDLHYFADGGTYALRLTDVQSNKVEMCLSNSKFTQIIPKEKEDLPETLDLIEDSKHINFFVGVAHPNYEGGEKIEYRSETETRILIAFRDSLKVIHSLKRNYLSSSQHLSWRGSSILYMSDLNKNPNQKLQPTVKTPVKSGNEQGTAAEI